MNEDKERFDVFIVKRVDEGLEIVKCCGTNMNSRQSDRRELAVLSMGLNEDHFSASEEAGKYKVGDIIK